MVRLNFYFTIGNGTRQGSVLSPYLFCRYIHELLAELSCSGIGCNIGGMLVNVLAYADDLVLFAPSWRALQQLLEIQQKHINTIDLRCNARKLVCMIFRPCHSSKVVSSCFPCFRLGCNVLQFLLLIYDAVHNDAITSQQCSTNPYLGLFRVLL